MSTKPKSLHGIISTLLTVLQYHLVSSTSRTDLRILFIFILLFSIYPITHLPVSTRQLSTWNRYYDPGKKFSFSHPPNWNVTTRHVDTSGFTEVTLTNPDSDRMKVSIVYTPQDAFLDSNTDRPALASRALTNLEAEMNADYLFFNSTGKFPHKYSIQAYESASDIVDYEKIEGQPGRMLIVLARVTDDDSLVFIYSESKRAFYKNLSNASQIIKSISI